MPISRLFLLVNLLALAHSAVFAQSASTSQAPPAEKVKPVVPAEARISYNSVHVDEPEIAMTFDDGPHATLTPKLLDLLAERHIKVTFFVLGECVEQNPDVLRRAAREGHEIGNHSWSHPQLNKMSDEAVRSQLRRTDDLIKSVTGKRPTLFRPPYGALTPRQKKWIHDEFGYEIIMWDVDPYDWKEPGPVTVCNRILKETRPGSIVLSHDIHSGTVAAMPSTLEQLAAKHFKFLTVSELIASATPEPPKPPSVHKQTALVPAGSPIGSPTAPMKAQSLSPSPAPPSTPTPSPGH
jgi:peptidoglycan-N-acetylglucosamine deacetylase